MGNQANIGEGFPFDRICDVGDVRVEIYLFAEEMRAFCQSRERKRIDFMALLFEPVGDALPTPSSIKGAPNKNESLTCGLSTSAADEGARQSCRDCACSSSETADQSTAGD